MLSALLYLRVTSLKNWVLSRVRRLKQPKYLIGAVVGAAYFWFFFLRRLVGHSPSVSVSGLGPGAEPFPIAFILVQIILVMAVGRLILAWIAPDKPGLQFTEPEIAFLFPAPLTRRSLIHFKLLGSQLTILASAVILTIISRRWNSLGGNAVIHAVGWWIIFSTINLHGYAAAFTVSRLVDHGINRTHRQIIVFGVMALLLAAVGYTIWYSLPPPTARELDDPTTLLRYAGKLTDTGVLHWLLLPVRMVAAPFFATDWRGFFSTLGPALAILGLHYLWVVRWESSFEEGSIALAEKRAQLVAATRAGSRPWMSDGTRQPRRGAFPLDSSGGRPEVAFLWKNLLSARSFLNHRTFIVVAVIIVGTHAWFSQGSFKQQSVLGAVGASALLVGGYVLMLGPQFARQDLRSDLANVDLFKTYPLRGWQIMLGEMLTPVAILTGTLWLTLLTAALDLGGLRSHSAIMDPTFRAAAAGCLAVITPLLCLLQLMIPNAATLLFPSWAQATRSRERGLDVMGQRLIFVGGQMLMILCALLPAAGLAILLGFAAHLVFGLIPSTLIATGGIVVVLLLEIFLGLWWLGYRFERFDLSNESVK